MNPIESGGNTSRSNDRDIMALTEQGFARVRQRNSEFQRKALLTFTGTVTLLLLIIVAGGSWSYYQYTQPAQRVTDYRICKYVDDKQGIELTGKRKYSYNESSILGLTIKKRDNVIEQTYLDLKGDAMAIVGFTNDGWHSASVGVGESGIEKLKPAHSYIVVMGTKVAVIDYDDFCK